MSGSASAGMADGAAAVGERLVAIYRAIAAGPMLRLPICNDRLEVQAVDFRRYDDHAVGVIVTPWFMNVVLAAVANGPALPPARRGDARAVALPAARIEVIVGEVPGFGRLDAASLFSPMFGFDGPGATREAAAAAMAALFTAPHDDANAYAAPARDRRALLFGRGAALS
ncbi:[NiFe]-hydrogenase assembly chaperone HybE [Blastochloris viridis]|uniref:Hydrogenase maturation factor HoxT/HybE n=2 Tax=Blastochloris viridis TaxID=1079 RepID=A0A0H5BPR8_BLAVI|nr:[NiFe]-hydrogenase assembly chaperone HybE [Blastochloris viridis]ALK10303.1 Hydrogenase-2 operon protein HybE [Blastochloris viridis]BAR99763.1 hydrogenase maturation factor HoxT/HybE [Blastochloris viridis]CUU42965.1 Hydrogenase-2 operon protein hybE [Blastochloris viridis]